LITFKLQQTIRKICGIILKVWKEFVSQKKIIAFEPRRNRNVGRPRKECVDKRRF